MTSGGTTLLDISVQPCRGSNQEGLIVTGSIRDPANLLKFTTKSVTAMCFKLKFFNSPLILNIELHESAIISVYIFHSLKKIIVVVGS